MTISLIPKKMLSFPDIWDDDNWLMPQSTQNGLSISEDEKNVYIETAIPGIDPKDVEITFQDGYIWVRAETKQEEKDKNKKFYRQATSSFSYRVAVPGEVDMNSEPEATYKHGVMTITFAKSPKVQPKKIQIKTIEK
jgi:HSP20 family protein